MNQKTVASSSAILSLMETLPSYLASLNQEQLAAVRHSGSNLLVHAGAGSGKTRVVIARILYHILEQGIAPWNILAVTFTNRAAREMRGRLVASLGLKQSEQVLIRTFHSFGAWFLRRHALEAGLASSFTIYDDDDSLALLKQAWHGCAKKAKLLQRLIARAKDSGLCYGAAPGTLPSADELEKFSQDPDFPKAFGLYQEALRRSGNADFADLLGLPVQVLEQYPQGKLQMQQRFCRILVDEYQDSNFLQNCLLHQLLAEPSRKMGQELCIVGDEDQSIYGFRGAEIRHILEFQQSFAPAKVLKLEQNYRSCTPILDLANQVIARNRERLGKELRSTKLGGNLPQFHLFENCEEEAVFVAQCIRKNPQWRTAVLYRTNAQSRTFERILREWKIPYRLVGNLSFYRREEIKDLVAFLKCLANPRDLVSFERIYNKPKRGLGPSVLQSIQAVMQQTGELGVGQAMQQVLGEKALISRKLKALAIFQQLYSKLEALLDPQGGPSDGLLLLEFIQEVLELSGLWAYYEGRDELELSERCLNFDNLLEEARHYGRGRRALVAFLESIELETEELDSEEVDSQRAEQQTLITMHNTKGLEFERVFVTGLELGVFPNSAALNDRHKMEEERRLFYVAITRAEQDLYLSAVQFRMLYGRLKYCEISPLLREIDPALYADCSPKKSGYKASVKNNLAHQKAELQHGLANCKQLSPELLRQMRKAQKPQKPKEPDPFVVGARVEHLDYGLGYVVQRKHSSVATTLMVKLDDGRLIRVQLEFQRSKLDFLGTGL